MRLDTVARLLVLSIALGVQASFCAAAEVSKSDNRALSAEEAERDTRGGDKSSSSKVRSFNPGQQGPSQKSPYSPSTGLGIPEGTKGGGSRVRGTGRKR